MRVVEKPCVPISKKSRMASVENPPFENREGMGAADVGVIQNALLTPPLKQQRAIGPAEAEGVRHRVFD